MNSRFNRIRYVLCLLVFGFFTRLTAAEPVSVAYAGLFLAGGAGAESRYPLYASCRDALRDTVRNILQRAAESGTFPFAVRFETATEETKRSIGDMYSLGIVLTRDDVMAEKFSIGATEINKTVVNVGLVAIIYQTGEDLSGALRNTVLFSLPLVGYSQSLNGAAGMSEADKQALFVSTAKTVLATRLAKRLATVSIGTFSGMVLSLKDSVAHIDIGATSGLESGQNVTFRSGDSAVGRGKVLSLGTADAFVKTAGDPAALAAGLKSGISVSGFSMRGISDETWQVTAFTISSKKAATMFSVDELGPQVAQWFSDFLSDKAGKTVLPPRVGGQWDQSATEQSFMIFTRDGQEYRFELPPPKYPVTLDLCGLSDKIIESNAVNDIWMFKTWLKVGVTPGDTGRTFDAYISKKTVPGMQEFNERSEFFDLLHTLTAKVVTEGAF